MIQQMLIPVLSSPFQPRIFTVIVGLGVLETLHPGDMMVEGGGKDMPGGERQL